MIEVGQPLPRVTLYEYREVESEGCSIGPNPVDTAQAAAGKTVLLFALPGAFTPTCSAQHLPGYVQNHDKLKAQGFEPTVFELGSRWLAWLGALIPWVHADDHPTQDRDALIYRVSMPASIEGFVRRTVAGAERIEICHDRQQVVVRRGWEPLAEGCVAGDGDRVVRLDR